jgi:NAD-dependent deacetylase
MVHNNDLEKFKELINNAKHIAFFGGAGVSTESGIPDFRSPDGLYNQRDTKYQPEYMLSHECLFRHPKDFYEFYRTKMDCRNFEPNVVHTKLAEWEQNGKRVSVMTQNIDGLHQKAGSKEVYELHGTTRKNYCTKCGREFPENAVFDSDEPIPRCPDCKGVGFIRPAVTLYGEQLPPAFTKAAEVLHHADLMIVAGTSLTVYPAANMIADFYGEHLVIINHDPTDYDGYANLIFHENLGDIFSKL